MIARMSKYDFVLFAAQCEDFIEKLRGIGLVDITTTGWEPSEEDRQLLLDIEGGAKAIECIASMRFEERIDEKAKPYASGEEAYEHFVAAHQTSLALNSDIGRLEKAADELRPWGEFSVECLRELADKGVVIRYFMAPCSNFDKAQVEWSEQYTISEVNRTDAMVYFAVIAAPSQEVAIDAQEMKTPAMDIREAESRIADFQKQLTALDAEFSRVAATEQKLTDHICSLKERLQDVRVKATAQPAADGTLVVMEGWAEKDTSAEVDALLEQYPNVVYLKNDPTPEDDTPVKLTNGWFASIFEMVGDMYARPKYGTMDLTPFFAPFYMFFFGICLNDAGYGAILVALGVWMLSKNKEQGMMRRAAWFATLCGISTVLFGGLCGSAFGLSLGDYFPNIPFFDFQGKFFNIALIIGLVQIMFGMVLNIWMKSRVFGVTSAFGTLGWFIILLSACLAYGFPMFGMAITGFEAGSIAFYAALGIGAVLMLLLNDVKRNPLVNFGAGIWDLYNNVMGLLSDVLSYIRLFAIGLSGGVLALVFNTLADGFVPEGANIVVRLLVMIPILLIGHGINLFMSCISSFVHPLRLTFVEFYKNAGFEMANRSFEPLRKVKNSND